MMSMTGFGRGRAATNRWQAVVEISTVNRKQAEVVINLPRELAELEPQLRQSVLAAVARGRAQVAVKLEPTGTTSAEVRLDEPLALALDQAFQQLTTLLRRPMVPCCGDFLRLPGIFSASAATIPADEAWEAISQALDQAIDALRQMRQSEGRDLKNDILARLNEVGLSLQQIEARVPGRLAQQREMLERRLREAGVETDFRDERFVRELALFADRCDISEEISRLHSHLAKFKQHLHEDPCPGRTLDFLCQELLRECNTIGAKAVDAEISHRVVDAKTSLEKIREQVQNVE